ncbi:MAG: hypothetical protein KGP35_09540 [Bacteroidetes bacterium]|nr:hypothetical protein [Bacteroidota bacterium]
MRSIKFLFFLATACLSFSISFAQSADEIISKYVSAIGGADNWKKVNTVVMSGSMSMQGTEISLVRTVAHNKGFKNEISVMGMSGYQILTPTEGWNFMPFNGQTAPEAMTADDVKEGQNDLDAQGAVVDYVAKGHSAEYLGKEEVDGTECHKVKFTYKNGKNETMFFDPASYYLIKSIAVQKANDQEVEITTTFSNYEKLAEGVVVAKSISLPLGPGVNADFTVSKIEINKTIDPAVFTPAK